MSIVAKVLNERGSVYGDYCQGLKFRGACLHLMVKTCGPLDCELAAETAISFTDIIGKVSRLLIVQLHKDSWVDLAGYARLNAKGCGDVKHSVMGQQVDRAAFVGQFWLLANASFLLINGHEARVPVSHRRHIKLLGERLFFISRFPKSAKAWTELAEMAEIELKSGRVS
jgi:hypothetical protein